ncbi:MAG TPA: aspartate kinase [Lentisphaeria bacterium]|nr:MAG: aspartate kinase [Lentisphaerae bacterium GWF2_49_21]HBC87523.1 aspartate kinase [Lentisphaeria bacterium]
MKGKHTVEKIGGTSMSQFKDVMNNIIIGKRKGRELYNRIFVVSAYAGITDDLLEHKKAGTPGIYAKFAAGDASWVKNLEDLRRKMIEINASFKSLKLDLKKADAFVNERMDGIKSCLEDLINLRSYGHLKPSDFLPASREMLSAVGEAHSAYNSTLILNANRVNAVYVDLTGWKETEQFSFDDMIKKAFKKIDLEKQLAIATGYTKCEEGIMTRFDRGYSEITFSKIAVLTGVKEGIIHKEYHLSTGDPKLIGVNKVKTIGSTNFNIADQLSDLGMEAIHSKASKEMEQCNIPIRVKNTFEPEHPGTVISNDYISPEPRVEMICGRKEVLAIEVHDPDMVGQSGYDYLLLKYFADYNISYIAVNSDANTITHYVPEKTQRIKECIEAMRKGFPGAEIKAKPVSIVCAIGSNMDIPGLLAKAAGALANAGINVLGMDQNIRQVNMQFIIERKHFEGAQIALHKELVEKK